MLTSAMLPRELASPTQQNFCKTAFIEMSAMEEKASTSSGSEAIDVNNNNLTAVAWKVSQRVTTCHMCNNYIKVGDQIIGCLIDGEERVWQCSDNCGNPLHTRYLSCFLHKHNFWLKLFSTQKCVKLRQNMWRSLSCGKISPHDRFLHISPQNTFCSTFIMWRTFSM